MSDQIKIEEAIAFWDKGDYNTYEAMSEYAKHKTAQLQEKLDFTSKMVDGYAKETKALKDEIEKANKKLAQANVNLSFHRQQTIDMGLAINGRDQIIKQRDEELSLMTRQYLSCQNLLDDYRKAILTKPDFDVKEWARESMELNTFLLDEPDTRKGFEAVRKFNNKWLSILGAPSQETKQEEKSDEVLEVLNNEWMSERSIQYEAGYDDTGWGFYKPLERLLLQGKIERKQDPHAETWYYRLKQEAQPREDKSTAEYLKAKKAFVKTWGMEDYEKGWQDVINDKAQPQEEITPSEAFEVGKWAAQGAIAPRLREAIDELAQASNESVTCDKTMGLIKASKSVVEAAKEVPVAKYAIPKKLIRRIQILKNNCNKHPKDASVLLAQNIQSVFDCAGKYPTIEPITMEERAVLDAALQWDNEDIDPHRGEGDLSDAIYAYKATKQPAK